MSPAGKWVLGGCGVMFVVGLILLALEAYNRRHLGTARVLPREVIRGAESLTVRHRMLVIQMKMHACLRDLRKALWANDLEEVARLDHEFEDGLAKLADLEKEFFG